MIPRRTLPFLVAVCAAVLAAPPASAKPIGFQTPNERVGCMVNGQGARCDVRKPKWEAPPPPANCELDYGQGVFVGRNGAADYVCAGDTTLDPDADVLRSGKKVRAGRFKCKNKGRNSIKCINKRTDAGFVVSRRSVRFLAQ